MITVLLQNFPLFVAGAALVFALFYTIWCIVQYNITLRPDTLPPPQPPRPRPGETSAEFSARLELWRTDWRAYAATETGSSL